MPSRLQSPPKTVPLLQSMFASLFNPYLFTKSSLQYPLYLSSFQTSLLLPTPIPIIYTKIFSLTQRFCYFSLCQRTRDLGNLVKSDTILISYFFLKVSKVIAGLTITDFFTKVQNTDVLLVYQIIQSNSSHTLHLLSLLPNPTNTTTRIYILLKPVA